MKRFVRRSSIASAGKKFTLVVVAERRTTARRKHDHQRSGRNDLAKRLGGIGDIVARGDPKPTASRETRVVVLGHLQRGGPPTTFDRVLATQFGAHAVRLVHQGQFGQMICFNPPRMDSVAIADAVSRLRTVDPHCDAVQAERSPGKQFWRLPETTQPVSCTGASGCWQYS